jgi:hypothetical protein
MIAFSRPFWPLFLHVFGAMVLFGAILTTATLSLAAWRRPHVAALRKGTLTALGVAVPAYIVFRIFAEVIYSDEKDIWNGNDPSWIGVGYGVADGGLLLLLVTIGFAVWWARRDRPVAGRVVAVLSSIYALALVIGWLAMSGKWG